MIDFIKDVIYGLKRDYGSRITIKRETTGSVNIETGVRSVTTEQVQIEKAIRLPTRLKALRLHESFRDQYDIDILIDKKDLGGFVPRNDDIVLLDDSLRYVVKDVVFADSGYAIGCNAAEGDE
jgi:hypothetical protein